MQGFSIAFPVLKSTTAGMAAVDLSKFLRAIFMPPSRRIVSLQAEYSTVNCECKE
jgi:hypothetical protein